MTALYIIAGFVLVIAFIFFSSVSVEIIADDVFELKIRYLFYKKVVPIKLQKKKGENSQEKPKKKTSPIKKMIAEQGLKNTILELLEVVKVILQKLGSLAKHIRVKRFKLLITVSADDPAVTGFEYGAICAVVYPFVAMLKNLMAFNDNKTEILLNSDFETDLQEFEFYSKMKVRVWFVLVAAMGVLLKLINSKIIKTKAKTNIETKTKSK